MRRYLRTLKTETLLHRKTFVFVKNSARGITRNNTFLLLQETIKIIYDCCTRCLQEGQTVKNKRKKSKEKTSANVSYIHIIHFFKTQHKRLKIKIIQTVFYIYETNLILRDKTFERILQN